MKKGSIDEKPLVSIITPVLNGIQYLETCITSVLEQSYPYIEHIFIDGGSTDGTLEMLADYQTNYPERIRLISEPGMGVGDAWNEGLRVARGQIFGWLGADDMSEPRAIQTVIEFFRDNTEAYFVFGDCNIIDEKGEIINRIQTKEFNLAEIIKVGCYVPTPSSFYKREVIEKVGYYSTLGNDLDYLIRVGRVFSVHRIKQVLSNFRVHEGSSTTGARKEIRLMWLRDDCQVSRRYGGGIFSGYCQRYYKFALIEKLRPMLGYAFPILRHLMQCCKKGWT